MSAARLAAPTTIFVKPATRGAALSPAAPGRRRWPAAATCLPAGAGTHGRRCRVHLASAERAPRGPQPRPVGRHSRGPRESGERSGVARLQCRDGQVTARSDRAGAGIYEVHRVEGVSIPRLT